MTDQLFRETALEKAGDQREHKADHAEHEAKQHNVPEPPERRELPANPQKSGDGGHHNVHADFDRTGQGRAKAQTCLDYPPCWASNLGHRASLYVTGSCLIISLASLEPAYITPVWGWFTISTTLLLALLLTERAARSMLGMSGHGIVDQSYDDGHPIFSPLVEHRFLLAFTGTLLAMPFEPAQRGAANLLMPPHGLSLLGASIGALCAVSLVGTLRARLPVTAGRPRT